jgi:hypothetical protein
MESEDIKLVRTPDNTFEIYNISEEQMEEIAAVLTFLAPSSYRSYDIVTQYREMGYDTEFAEDYNIQINELVIEDNKIVDICADIVKVSN